MTYSGSILQDRQEEEQEVLFYYYYNHHPSQLNPKITYNNIPISIPV